MIWRALTILQKAFGKHCRPCPHCHTLTGTGHRPFGLRGAQSHSGQLCLVPENSADKPHGSHP